MRSKITLVTMLLAFTWMNHRSSAQALFKDLDPGTPSSNPAQFINVNGTMYFITNTSPGYVHQLWKSDGTVANTVMVKDSIIITNIGGIITFIDFNGTLYYMLNKNGSSTSATITEMWKTDGTTAGTVLVTTLTNANPLGGSGDTPPSHYVVAGSNLYFQFGSGHGLELWVSDGTAAGTMEVVDLNPGNNGSGYNYGGVVSQDMIGYNGKVYFSGGSTIGSTDLYVSDGTSAGTIKVAGSPTFTQAKNFIVFNNELYFQGYASGLDGIWKTDGTTAGTVNINNSGFNNNTKIFNNAMYYTVNGTLWKSDGTTAGTVAIKDSVGGMTGMLGNVFYTSYMKSLSYAPYYTMYYWQSDGTTSGTTRISKVLGKAASFWVLNNKMYNSVADTVGYTSGLWESDGTLAGTTDLLTGYLSYPFIFNSTVFFTNSTSPYGYELWSLTPTASGVATLSLDEKGVRVSPNPSSGIFYIDGAVAESTTLRIYNGIGEQVGAYKAEQAGKLDLSYLPGGFYYVQCDMNGHSSTQKIIINK